MSKKKSKKPRNTTQRKNTGPPRPAVRLSQCMIVKNEEKNIEKALSWARDVAFEQIVVDTGSTDRTVELAEKMGAKIYHFEWINDFSAAKNFAMDKASGNWIAILDADEYMSGEDVKEMMSLLKKVQSNPQHLKEFDALTCSWVQLDDEGKAFAVLTQQRIFQNRPDLRYKGTIHEAVRIRNKYLNAENLRIMHTGYAQTAYGAADKRERNIKLLRDELEKDPTNPHTMLYLADSIKASGTEESRVEAEELYLAGLASKRTADPAIRRLAYDFLIPRFMVDEKKTDEAVTLCDAAVSDLPSNIDYYYYRAFLNNQLKNYEAAMKDLLKCEQALMNSTTVPETRVLMSCPVLLFYQLSIAASGLDDKDNTIKYDTIVDTMLTEGKDQPEVLGPFLTTMFQQKKTGIEVFEKLTKIYNLNDPKELMFIARTSKDYGILLFAKMVMEMAGEMLGR